MLSISPIVAAETHMIAYHMNKVSAYAKVHGVSLGDAETRLLQIQLQWNEKVAFTAAARGVSAEEASVLLVAAGETAPGSLGAPLTNLTSAAAVAKQVAYYAGTGSSAASSTGSSTVAVSAGVDPMFVHRHSRELVRYDEVDRLIRGVAADGGSLVDPRRVSLAKLLRDLGLDEGLADDASTIRCLRERIHPVTGAALTGDDLARVQATWRTSSTSPATVTAIDLTFSAPKDVSIMRAFGSSAQQARIDAIQVEAVEASLKQMEAMGLVLARRGKGGGEKLTARLTDVLMKTELSSRAGDPQLHTHTLISTAVEGADGRRTRVDSQAIHYSSKIAGSYYRAYLKQAMSEQFGVGWIHRADGLSEMLGTSAATREKYSTRSQQIAEALASSEAEDAQIVMTVTERLSHYEQAAERVASRGPTWTPAGAGMTTEQVIMQDHLAKTYAVYREILRQEQSGTALASRRQNATLITKVRKSEEVAEMAEARWATETGRPNVSTMLAGAQARQAIRLGHTFAWLQTQLANVDEKHTLEQHERDAMKAKLREEFLPVDEQAFFEHVEHLLTVNSTMFNRKRVVEMIYARWPFDVEDLESAVEDFFKRGTVVFPQQDPPSTEPGDWVKFPTDLWTTTAVLAQQQKIYDIGRKLASSDDGVKVPAELLAAALAKYGLSKEQGYAVAVPLLTGGRLGVQIAPAGAGKTYGAGCSVELYHAVGYKVFGASTKADTGRKLVAETGMDGGGSIAELLTWDKSGYRPAGPTRNQIAWRIKLQDEQRALDAAIQTSRVTLRGAALAGAETEYVAASARITTQLADLADQIAGITPMMRAARAHYEGSLTAFNADLPTMDPATRVIRRRALDAEEAAITRAENAARTWVRLEDDGSNVAVMLDEAAMTSDGQLLQVLEMCDRRGWSLLLSGDARQLQAVERGDGWEILSNLGVTTELTTTRRAKAAWERELQEEWHDLPSLSPDPADPQRGALLAHARQLVDELVDEDRVTIIDQARVRDGLNAGEVSAVNEDRLRTLAHTELVEKWLTACDAGESAVLLALRRSDVDAMNSMVQATRIAAGALDGDGPSVVVTADASAGVTQRVHVGDAVRMQSNLGKVKNGMPGTVVGVTSNGSLEVLLPTKPGGGMSVHKIPAKKLATGVLALGYAQTVHSAQGITVDRGFLLADESTSRELLYSGMTRGRDENSLTLIRSTDSSGGEDDDRDLLAKMFVTSDVVHSALSMTMRGISDRDVVQFRNSLRPAEEVSLKEAYERLSVLRDQAAIASARAARVLAARGEQAYYAMMQAQKPSAPAPAVAPSRVRI